jgi:hypothetical protein
VSIASRSARCIWLALSRCSSALSIFFTRVRTCGPACQSDAPLNSVRALLDGSGRTGRRRGSDVCEECFATIGDRTRRVGLPARVIPLSPHRLAGRLSRIRRLVEVTHLPMADLSEVVAPAALRRGPWRWICSEWIRKQGPDLLSIRSTGL